MRINKKGILLVLALVIVSGVVGIYYYIKYTRYSSIQVVETHERIGKDNGNYIQYAGGVLKYSKDGIAFLTQEGAQKWNQSCQMTNPMTEVNGETVAVADQSGTSILVFEKKGLKGEIKTTRPIEKVAVSRQGIVAAVLQDAEAPQVICYDAKGNVLVKHTASFENTGYPIDIAISDDGKVLLVSYLCIDGNMMNTKVSYFHFGEAGENKTDHLVAQKEYQDTIIPTTAFIGKSKSILISEKSLIIYESHETPKEDKVIQLEKEIKSVAYDERYVAYVLKNKESSSYELRIFSTSGEQIGSTKFEGEYANIKIAGKEIILFSANMCAIFTEKGVCRYQGTYENNIIDIFPISGLNKYMMISVNGFEEVQLTK